MNKHKKKKKALYVTHVFLGEAIHSTGELSTASALKGKGWEIDFMHPRNELGSELLDNYGLGSYPAMKSKFPFLGDISYIIAVMKILPKILDDNDYDVIISEWTCSIGVSRVLENRKKKGSSSPPWIYEDRSPPAKRSLSSRLQWLHYDYVWRNVAKRADAIEVLVPGLEKFVNSRYGNYPEMIHCPSGVNLERFIPIKSDNEALRIVYHGSLDGGRGLHRIIEFGEMLDSEGVEFRILIFGVGNLTNFFRNESKKRSWLEFGGAKEYAEVPKLVAENDIGILPLPDALAWNVGSPLKVMEYAASGLCVLTTDVDGTVPFSGQDWLVRSPKESPLGSWLEFIVDFPYNKKDLEEKKANARSYAENNLSWDIAVSDLHNKMIELSDKS